MYGGRAKVTRPPIILSYPHSSTTPRV